MRRTARIFAAAAALMAIVLGPGPAWAAPTPIPGPDGSVSAPARTQISFVSLPGGRTGTANEHESRTAMSIVKLYLAEHVVRHGDPEDRGAAVEMIRASDDVIADRLSSKYPGAIEATISEFGLVDTYGSGYWGTATTSTYDMVTYLETKIRTDPGSPVLAAMASAHELSADGYPQNFGTSLLPGVIGTKWGWTDDHSSAHASASFGSDFVVAASTYGSAGQLSADVAAAFADEPAAPRAITPLCTPSVPPLCTVGIQGFVSG
ncbi:hypothetical protein [Rhodococcus phenolicus]|uniref:hypothetical protein n=1 Tax=Rhodococcus phenolicus TaxID=263849 RepID=UPI0008341988|nr:hypothetical protein [Rhodococcus phenolicus]